MRTVVIGVGNPTLSDDGVGIRAAREIGRRVGAGAGTDVGELCAGGLRLMEAMVGYDRAIVVDALTTGSLPPGTLVELGLGDLVATRNVACAHDMSLPVALALGRAAGVPLPARVDILGVEAADVTTFAEALTPAVESAVPAVVERVLALLAGAA